MLLKGSRLKYNKLKGIKYKNIRYLDVIYHVIYQIQKVHLNCLLKWVTLECCSLGLQSFSLKLGVRTFSSLNYLNNNLVNVKRSFLFDFCFVFHNICFILISANDFSLWVNANNNNYIIITLYKLIHYHIIK